MKLNIKNLRISIIGLGYVGLPLAIEFGSVANVIGFDKNHQRIIDLKNKIDTNFEITKSDFRKAKNLNFTNKLSDIKNSNIYIVTVPTPIKLNKEPDLRLIKNATNDVAKFL